ncbi:MAG: PDDEXK nuclease domain-containing protein [Bacteroidales bacterium]
MKSLPEENKSLNSQIKQWIDESKQQIAVSVNSTMTLLYWRIGKRIKEEILQDKRAEYGKQVIANLSKDLTLLYGKGWSEQQLRHCLRSAEVFPDDSILYALSIDLSWTHIRKLMFIDDELKRSFYIEICKNEHWSSRTLSERIDSMLYERTAISRKPEQTIKADLSLLKEERKMTPEMVFRDPLFLDFLGLQDTYSEKDLESAILSHLQEFILEIGTDFAFMARQKRIVIGDKDYYIDLLFYHRKLRRMVVIELKLGPFRPEHKSQLELYLRWLDKYERAEGEESPLGILLCAEKDDELVELLELGQSGIHVANYYTELPPVDWLKSKLNQSIEVSKQRISACL